jgi:hypothetical protein
MKRDPLSILLVLAMSSLLIFFCVNACYDDTMGTNDFATRGNEDGDTEDSPDAQLDYTGVTVPLKASFLFLEGYFFGFPAGFSLPIPLILSPTSTLRC